LWIHHTSEPDAAHLPYCRERRLRAASEVLQSEELMFHRVAQRRTLSSLAIIGYLLKNGNTKSKFEARFGLSAKFATRKHYALPYRMTKSKSANQF
jgi:hypothetical protein